MSTPAEKFLESHPFITDVIWSSNKVNPSSPDDYLDEEIYRRVDEIGDVNDALRQISEATYRALAEPFRNDNYDYACGMMTVYFSRTVNPDGAT